jgi:predicted Rdx family selenoprotein
VAELSGTRFTAEMVAGDRSQFDVVVDGQMLFSKRREGRFPDVDEILARLPPPS